MEFSCFVPCNKSIIIKTYIAEVDGLDARYRYSRDFLKTKVYRNLRSVEVEADLSEFSLFEFSVVSFDTKRYEKKEMRKWLVTTCDDAILELDYDEIREEDVPCLLFQLMYMKKLYSEGRDLLSEVVASIGC